MISGLSSWAEGIVYAIVIVTIIEMILPNNKNKKYIKTILGLFILITILSPIIKSVTNKDFEIDYSFAKEIKNKTNYNNTYKSYQINTNKNIEDVYMNNLKYEIKNTIEVEGYKVNNIVVIIENQKEENYGEIQKLEINITEENDNKVNEIQNISINIADKEEKNEISLDKQMKLKECIEKNYGIDKSNIVIKTN